MRSSHQGGVGAGFHLAIHAGFPPRSLLELLRRRGKIRPEDLRRLDMAVELDVRQIKVEWQQALQEAETFINERSPDEVGCLYYSLKAEGFVNPNRSGDPVVPHFGRPGGVPPRIPE